MENILESLAPTELLKKCEKMVFDFFIFVKDPEEILESIKSVISVIKDENASKAVFITLGKLLDFRDQIIKLPNCSENDFELFRSSIATLLFNIIKGGKSLLRIYAYTSLGRLGLLYNYEKEAKWYEDYFREFKFESQQLSKDPFLEEFKNSLFIGIKRLIKINSKTFVLKKESLRNMVLSQAQKMKEKGDKLSESIFKEILQIFNS